MDNYSYLYELFIDNLSVYKSTNLNFVFHEYLNFIKFNKINMIIKKKLLDNMKHFDLFLEEILFDTKLKVFKSDIQIYDLSSVSYLTKLLNEINSNNEIKKDNPEQKVKIIPKKNLPKVKVVNFNKIEKQEKEEVIEPELDENKLEELEELILKLEEEKEKKEEILEKEKEIISNKEMEEREIKMKERSMNDKKKEINNIFESDKRLYFNFKQIQELIEKYKKNPKLFENNNSYSLTHNERRAKLLVDNNQNFEIPDLFLHKYPIFKFLDENNLIEKQYTLFAYKLIYYNNYEKNTESRKYFDNDVYLLNKDDEQLFNENFTDEEKELIYKFSLELSNKIVDMEKVISNKLQSSTDKIFRSNTNYKQDYENISQSSEYDNSDDNSSVYSKSTETTTDKQDNDSICSDSTDATFEYK
jgi:hypothetical protein